MKPFSVPFDEPADVQIAKARAERVMLAPEFYRLAPEARAQAFTVSGIARLDQVQTIADSLARAQAEGTGFAEWRKWALQQDWGLPPARLETIYRNAVQTSYNAGQWRYFLANQGNRPFLLYDAINDARVRPSHLAMDGVIRPVDDPIWRTHAPPRGHNCRCSLRAITREKARRLGGVTQSIPAEADPDPGWASAPQDWSDALARMAKARAERETSRAGAPYVHRRTAEATREIARIIAAARTADMNEDVMRAAIGDDLWTQAVRSVTSRPLPPEVAAARLSQPEIAALNVWTRPDWAPRINRALRAAAVDAKDMREAWPVASAIRSALDKLPRHNGLVFRIIDRDMPGADAILGAYRPGARVMLNGLTSATTEPLGPGRIVLMIDSRQARRIAWASIEPEHGEVLFPHGTALRVRLREDRPDGEVRIWLTD